VIDAVEKLAGDDLDSLVVEVRYHDARTGEKHSECFDVGRIMASAGPDEIGWLESFIIIDLDERLTAID
jgi:hypothetical protein